MKYKVGDVLKILSTDTIFTIGDIVMVDDFDPSDKTYYVLKGTIKDWVDEEDLQKVKKELTDMEVGDIVIDGGGEERKVIEVLTNTFLPSIKDNHTKASICLFSFKEAEEAGWKLKDQEPEEEIVEVLGKKYKKSELKERLEELEEVQS